MPSLLPKLYYSATLPGKKERGKIAAYEVVTVIAVFAMVVVAVTVMVVALGGVFVCVTVWLLVIVSVIVAADCVTVCVAVKV